jgi:hypothetical protein
MSDNNPEDVKIEEFQLEDGRRAEKHVVVDEKGVEVEEVFAEQKPVLKIEKRIIRESKNIIVKEIHQTLKDGTVVDENVFEISPEAFSLTKKEKVSKNESKSIVKAADLIEEKVEKKNKTNNIVNVVLVSLIVLQILFLLGYLLWN